MFIRFFKTDQPASLLAIPLMLMLLWIPAWRTPYSETVLNPMPVFGLFLRVVSLVPESLHVVLATLFAITTALMLNYYVRQNEVLYRKSYLPALIAITFLSGIRSFQWLSPALVAAPLVVFTLGKIFQLYKNDGSLRISFDIGFLFAICALIYLPAIIFLPFVFISLVVLRPFVWREWLSPLLGYFLPFFFTAIYYFWNDGLNVFLNVISAGIGSERTSFLPIMKQLSSTEMYFAGFSIVLILLSLNHSVKYFFKNVIRTRNYQQVLLLLVFLCCLPFLLPSGMPIYIFIWAAIPLSVFVGGYFLSIKKAWLAEVLFIMWILLLLYNQIS